MVDGHLGLGIFCIMGRALPTSIGASEYMIMHIVCFLLFHQACIYHMTSIYSFHRPYRALDISFDQKRHVLAYSKQAKMVHFLFSASGNARLLGP